LKGLVLPGNEATVTELDLSHNRIGVVEDQAFDGFTALVELRLSHNVLRGDDISK
jgi:hypothetical protein